MRTLLKLIAGATAVVVVAVMLPMTKELYLSVVSAVIEMSLFIDHFLVLESIGIVLMSLCIVSVWSSKRGFALALSVGALAIVGFQVFLWWFFKFTDRLTVDVTFFYFLLFFTAMMNCTGQFILEFPQETAHLGKKLLNTVFPLAYILIMIGETIVKEG